MSVARGQLSVKQEAFVDEYMLSRDASKAAVKAGYSYDVSNAYKLLRVPKIKEEIDRRLKLITKKSARGVEELLADIRKVTMESMKDPKREFQALKGLELEAKILGLLDKSKVTHDGEINIKVSLPE